MTAPTPMYMFQPYWLHEVYCNGVESSARTYCSSPPIAGSVVQIASGLDGVKDREETFSFSVKKGWPFYWCPIIKNIGNGNFAVPSMEVVGFRLYSKELADENSYRPTIEILKSSSGEYHLYSCRRFEVGEAITLLSKFEQRIGKLFLGGYCAKTDNVPSECNVRLTGGCALRCTKPILSGEEIVRYSSDESCNNFDRMDRVVLSPRDWKVGRITGGGKNDQLTVEYVDGSHETTDRKSLIGYCYREPG